MMKQAEQPELSGEAKLASCKASQGVLPAWLKVGAYHCRQRGGRVHADARFCGGHDRALQSTEAHTQALRLPDPHAARISCSAPVSCYITSNEAMLHLMPSCREQLCGLIPGIRHIGANLSGSAKQTCPYPNLKALDTNYVRIAQHCHSCRLEMHWQSCQRWWMSVFQTTSISQCAETHTGSSMTSATSLS